ncbi:hypothetical protein A4X09_0g3970 [Tilletia walkeri]|uniref:Uncharacterized protein n=1 Tax=Tilletia walkeri TaxID=117179 RepID=A0A8X7NA83_9BASI|nr:hypothetical protein A4X09_0g3970 [Tilletia walkeri]
MRFTTSITALLAFAILATAAPASVDDAPSPDLAQRDPPQANWVPGRPWGQPDTPAAQHSQAQEHSQAPEHAHGGPAKDWGIGGWGNAWKKDLPCQAQGHGQGHGGPAKDWGGGGWGNAWKKDVDCSAQGNGHGQGPPPSAGPPAPADDEEEDDHPDHPDHPDPPAGGPPSPGKDWGWGGGHAWKKSTVNAPSPAQDFATGHGWKRTPTPQLSEAPTPAKDWPSGKPWKRVPEPTSAAGAGAMRRHGSEKGEAEKAEHAHGGPAKDWTMQQGWKKRSEGERVEEQKRLLGLKRPSFFQPQTQQQQKATTPAPAPAPAPASTTLATQAAATTQTQQQAAAVVADEPLVGVSTGPVEEVLAPVVAVDTPAPAPAKDWGRMKAWKRHEHESQHHH